MKILPPRVAPGERRDAGRTALCGEPEPLGGVKKINPMQKTSLPQSVSNRRNGQLPAAYQKTYAGRQASQSG